MNILIEYIGIGTAPPNVAIWEKFGEQHQHQINNKNTIFNAQWANLHFFG